MLPESGNETQNMVACTPRSQFIFTFVIPASCLFIILIFPANNFFFGCFSAIINFLVGSHLVCACHGAVLGSEIRSTQHTCLLAASVYARLVCKYFSSIKGRERDTACSHCNVLVLYHTRTILYVFDGCRTYF